MPRVAHRACTRVALLRAWPQKPDTDNCELCDKKFGRIFRRRHHCRNCGKCVCHECSDNTWDLAATIKAARVCDECYEKFTEESKGDSKALASLQKKLDKGIINQAEYDLMVGRISGRASSRKFAAAADVARIAASGTGAKHSGPPQLVAVIKPPEPELDAAVAQALQRATACGPGDQ